MKQFKTANLYDEVKQRGIPIDNHESDMYIPVTDETTQLLKDWDYPHTYTTFKSQIDGKFWYDIPFAYQPWWDARLS